MYTYYIYILYILWIDSGYLNKLHQMHNDYPLAPEKLWISHNMSNYWSNIANDYRIKIGNIDRLVPNLGNKSKYALHYRNLQMYLVTRNEISS